MRLPKPFVPAPDFAELQSLAKVTFNKEQRGKIVAALADHVGRDVVWADQYLSRCIDGEGETRDIDVRPGPKVLAELSAAASKAAEHTRQARHLFSEAKWIEAYEPLCVEPFLASLSTGPKPIGVDELNDLAERLEALSNAALAHSTARRGTRPDQQFDAFVIALKEIYESATGKPTRLGWQHAEGEKEVDPKLYLEGRPASPLIDFIQAVVGYLPDDMNIPSEAHISYIVRRICNNTEPLPN